MSAIEVIFTSVAKHKTKLYSTTAFKLEIVNVKSYCAKY